MLKWTFNLVLKVCSPHLLNFPEKNYSTMLYIFQRIRVCTNILPWVCNLEQHVKDKETAKTVDWQIIKISGLLLKWLNGLKAQFVQLAKCIQFYVWKLTSVFLELCMVLDELLTLLVCGLLPMFHNWGFFFK